MGDDRPSRQATGLIHNLSRSKDRHPGIAQPQATNAASTVGQLPPGESAVMYRGRAAEKLAPQDARFPWTQFTTCPHEDLREPGRMHLDPLGNLHICQGLVAGNLFETPLDEICAAYDPDVHPIVGPLPEGGPAELVRCYGLSHQDGLTRTAMPMPAIYVTKRGGRCVGDSQRSLNPIRCMAHQNEVERRRTPARDSARRLTAGSAPATRAAPVPGVCHAR